MNVSASAKSSGCSQVAAQQLVAQFLGQGQGDVRVVGAVAAVVGAEAHGVGHGRVEGRVGFARQQVGGVVVLLGLDVGVAVAFQLAVQLVDVQPAGVERVAKPVFVVNHQVDGCHRVARYGPGPGAVGVVAHVSGRYPVVVRAVQLGQEAGLVVAKLRVGVGTHVARAGLGVDRVYGTERDWAV